MNKKMIAVNYFYLWDVFKNQVVDIYPKDVSIMIVNTYNKTTPSGYRLYNYDNVPRKVTP